jgi:hypothetical protein
MKGWYKLMCNETVWDITEVGEWLDAKFYDKETGEIFLVELKKEEGEEMEDFITKCQEIADDNFDYACFMYLLTDEEGEILGYDTY